MAKKLYQTVIDYINEQISCGLLTIGDLIPSESQLSKLLGVSVGTVRKAIDILENDKLLYRHHGKGTYVSDYGFDNSIFNFFSIPVRGSVQIFSARKVVTRTFSSAPKAHSGVTTTDVTASKSTT